MSGAEPRKTCGSSAYPLFAMPLWPLPSSGRAGNTAPVRNDVHVGLPSYDRLRSERWMATGPCVSWQATQLMPSIAAVGSRSRSGARERAAPCADHVGIELRRFSPGAWQLTHQCSPPEPLTASPLFSSRHTSAPAFRRIPAPFGQRASRPTSSSTTLSSAPKSGLLAACAITDRCHSSTSRAWHATQSAALVPARRAPTRSREAARTGAGGGDGAARIAAAAMGATTSGTTTATMRARLRVGEELNRKAGEDGKGRRGFTSLSLPARPSRLPVFLLTPSFGAGAASPKSASHARTMAEAVTGGGPWARGVEEREHEALHAGAELAGDRVLEGRYGGALLGELRVEAEAPRRRTGGRPRAVGTRRDRPRSGSRRCPTARAFDLLGRRPLGRRDAASAWRFVARADPRVHERVRADPRGRLAHDACGGEGPREEPCLLARVERARDGADERHHLSPRPALAANRARRAVAKPGRGSPRPRPRPRHRPRSRRGSPRPARPGAARRLRPRAVVPRPHAGPPG